MGTSDNTPKNDRTQEYRDLARQQGKAQKRLSTLQENIIAFRSRTIGYNVLCKNDDETRKMFKISKLVKAADLVINNRPNTCIVADAKSKSEISKSVEQLRNTIVEVRKQYACVEPKIYVSTSLESNNSGIPANRNNAQQGAIKTSQSPLRQSPLTEAPKDSNLIGLEGNYFAQKLGIGNYILTNEKAEPILADGELIEVIFGP